MHPALKKGPLFTKKHICIFHFFTKKPFPLFFTKNTPYFPVFLQKNTFPFHFLPTGLLPGILHCLKTIRNGVSKKHFLLWRKIHLLQYNISGHDCLNRFNCILRRIDVLANFHSTVFKFPLALTSNMRRPLK